MQYTNYQSYTSTMYFIRNEKVVGSSPTRGSKIKP